MKRLLLLIIPTLLLICASCEPKNKALEVKDDPQLSKLKVPEGFTISFFAKNVDNARSLALGENGTVFVGNRKGKNVYALVDADKDGVAEKKYTVASGLNTPNGVAFCNGSLYIAEVSKIWRIDNIESTLENPAKPILVNDSFPTEEQHGWKYIAFGPDGKLYVPVGAPCVHTGLAAAPFPDGPHGVSLVSAWARHSWHVTLPSARVQRLMAYARGSPHAVIGPHVRQVRRHGAVLGLRDSIIRTANLWFDFRIKRAHVNTRKA